MYLTLFDMPVLLACDKLLHASNTGIIETWLSKYSSYSLQPVSGPAIPLE